MHLDEKFSITNLKITEKGFIFGVSMSYQMISDVLAQKKIPY